MPNNLQCLALLKSCDLDRNAEAKKNVKINESLGREI